MALLDVLALLDATSIYRGAIIRIGNAPATSDGPSRSRCMRDMVPNHVFQLLTMTTMEPPMSFEADAVRHVTAFDQGTLSVTSHGRIRFLRPP
jgi:Glucose-6-phosphate dehydrogenase, C-terminal domain